MTNNEIKKDLSKDLITNIGNVGSVLTKLERVEFLLGELVEDYSFDVSLNLQLTGRHADKWLYEYVRIQQFINMAHEYASYSKEDIENILNDLKALRQEAV